MCALVFVLRDFELGRTCLAGRVDRQSCTVLIFISTLQCSGAVGWVTGRASATTIHISLEGWRNLEGNLTWNNSGKMGR